MSYAVVGTTLTIQTYVLLLGKCKCVKAVSWVMRKVEYLHLKKDEKWSNPLSASWKLGG